MFGMTKRQFLKRTKIILNKTGQEALSIRGIFDYEKNGVKIGDNQIHKRIDMLRVSVDELFFAYEKLNPPSECVSLQNKILHALITLQEAVAANYEYVTIAIETDQIDVENKLEESKILIEKFRTEFRSVITEVDSLKKI